MNTLKKVYHQKYSELARPAPKFIGKVVGGEIIGDGTLGGEILGDQNLCII